jgi:protoporphyrinogen oxidase
VIEMTTLVDRAELGGHSLVYLPRYAAEDDEAWRWSDADVEERFLAALSHMYPHFRREHVRAFRVSRVKHVMALPTLGYSDRLPPLATAARNVIAVNSAHIVKGTLNVNEVVELANDAFANVLAPSIQAATFEQTMALQTPHAVPQFVEGGLERDVEAAGELVARS